MVWKTVMITEVELSMCDVPLRKKRKTECFTSVPIIMLWSCFIQCRPSQ